jgi:AcrR family transcriptional regulator
MRRRTEETQKIIVQAAGQLFLDRGYAAASMDLIAARAGVTKRTIYGYFPDKRSLFLGVIDDAVGKPWELHIPLRSIATLDDMSRALYAVAAGLNDVIARPDYVQLLRVAIAEVRVQPDLSVLFEQGITQRSLKILGNLFKVAHDCELLVVEDAEATARLFVGDFVVRMLLDGLLRPVSQVAKRSPKELRLYVAAFMQAHAMRLAHQAHAA